MAHHINLAGTFRLSGLLLLVFIQTSVLTTVTLKLFHGDLQTSLIVLGMLFPLIWALLWTYTSYRPRNLIWWFINIFATLLLIVIVLLLKPVA